MHRILGSKSKRDRKTYDKENLKKDYAATLKGMSVYRACRLYQVPESTLRDRTRNKVSLDCKSGPTTIFTYSEEKQLVELVDHIVYLGNIGYGYSVQEMKYLAADYAGNLMREHDLLTAPERIYNIDESGSSTEHTPPKIICDKTTKPQSVTSPRSKNVTIIGGANAIGNHVPPFYIFPGKRWNDSLLDGAVAGAAGGMSESGWFNRGLFEEYIINHFARHVGLDRGDRPTTLILYDGHKSHLSLTLTQWAKDHRVILFVLPPHSSHLTQPLDVGVFGPMKKFFYQECKLYMHANPGVSITRYEVAKLTNKPFSKAFSPINIISAFKKSGMYPFDSEKNIRETNSSCYYLQY
ncbi:uncharacterized protein LOC128546748 [Mercenaria mercenaria]|uniref:uncharacterized protein LOC128546748 n=1 Tax=Mercenaria mercenaria TaxID=6596 RepID=UPI00234F8657|nr:uncharacterized protein LOC128546748 [Mercenaria mercenaria]